jgi:NitT/TauT family transport system substrate-binding protein
MRAGALLAIVVILLGLLPACKTADAAPPPVRIGYFANLTHAQAVLGVASGDFGRAVAPVPLETRVFNAGPSLVEALFAGEIDIGYVGPGPAIAGNAKSYGEGIRVIAGAAADGVVIVARNGSGITRMEDLAGKRLGTPQLGNTQDVSARHYLSAVLKVPIDGIVPVENSQQAALFARGQLDAAWVPEPWGQRLVSETGATIVAEEKDLWPDKEFALTLVVTTPEFLSKHPDVVKKVLEVHERWTKELSKDAQAHVQELGDALAALTGKRLPPDVLPAALGRVKFIDEPLPSTLRTFAAWAQDLGYERRTVGLDALVDTRILESCR